MEQNIAALKILAVAYTLILILQPIMRKFISKWSLKQIKIEFMVFAVNSIVIVLLVYLKFIKYAS